MGLKIKGDVFSCCQMERDICIKDYAVRRMCLRFGFIQKTRNLMIHSKLFRCKNWMFLTPWVATRGRFSRALTLIWALFR